MRGTFISRLRAGTSNLIRDQRGNAMMLTAAMILPIIGFAGSGIDIGRAYMAQIRLQQACDAGTLAGRRAMAGGTYNAAAKAEASKMFAVNYSSTAYGSTGVTFNTVAQGTANVNGTATAHLPTTVMRVFAFDGFDLTVNCTAKLEISNTDVMMVLDVTGSMTTVNSGDSVDRMTALKNATMDFFDTLTTADLGDGRLRFGVVPYSSTANVGKILYDKNPDWLSNTTTLPSRTGGAVTWTNPQTNTGTASNGPATVVSSPEWSDTGNTISGKNSTTCPATTPQANSSATTSGGSSTTQTGQYIDATGDRVTTSDTTQNYRYFNYSYYWVAGSPSGTCRERRRTMQYTQTTPKTVTEDRVQNYTYQDQTFDVTSAKAGTALDTLTGDGGTAFSANWGGCVIERNTTAFASNAAAPSTALDMDVDTAPTSDDKTKWKLLIPEVAFPRASGPGGTPPSPTTNPRVVNYNDVTRDNAGSNGSWQRYSKYWSNGWGVCPVPAMKLTTMTKTDRGTFDSYVSSLAAVGGTYHDSGMVWGIRLLSPDGMFADENATAPNGRPIGRHIVFMTDGDMSANMGNLTFQGYEWTMKRVGGTSDSDLTARHNNRFLQLCEKAKSKNITVWVVGFGTALNTQLTTCATPGKAYQAANAAQLKENFQAIARQISRLRLSQ